METAKKTEDFFEKNFLIGTDKGLAGVMEQVEQVAETGTSVLLIGETGVGKGIIASLIHQKSNRSHHSFVSVNCGAIPETLIDSELFGHEKGAFTGAVLRKQGRFERAHQGTIFLDEIGELPLSAQVRLLNVIQNREIERVGGNQPLSVDIRIISATHRNLQSMVVNGSFRKDLWFRLNVFPIHIPPLRRRKTDIPDLARYFIRKKMAVLNPEFEPDISDSGMRLLTDHNWPGNVRELENVIERAMISCKGRFLDFSDIMVQNHEFILSEPQQDFKTPQGRVQFLSLEQVNRIHISRALNSAKGKINGPGGAAELLCVHPNTLRKRMDRLGIQYGRSRSAVFS